MADIDVGTLTCYEQDDNLDILGGLRLSLTERCRISLIT